ncbi:MAG: hydantoinase/oxoprolinase family protein [Candidatus Kapabacteria bacterium]|jgi:N-methylhydantoinase A/oxoprolinase/acetone carboxylase beta subunit|nr:hydantoinase/oxoprolinase family protein [Candidatus Kapabacteria bacterium]
MPYRLGIDIGGTFTDFVLLNETSGDLHFGKTLTTYPDPTNGIITGTKQVLNDFNVNAAAIHTIVHGTTLVTNAVIERKGAKTGFITTQGFTDVPEIGRELRYDIYDIFLTMPEPLVPQKLRVGVEERLNAKGEVVMALTQASIERAVETLVGRGVQSIAVCLLHSFVNPAHERIIAEIIHQKYPHIYTSLSVDIMPEIREYERASATIMNAYVQPITDKYLETLEKRLRVLGFTGNIDIMISSGRLTTIEGARKSPVQLLESGPAGGAMASVFFGKLTGRADLLGFDMGGTTAKASLILNNRPEITNQFEAARVRRFKKGSGLPVRIPVIDLIEIGAGGGSIAHIDHLGLLKVGPESAASQPGPACYGRGGDKPTVTDADLILGYLNEKYFLGGTMTLDREAAREAVHRHIAEPLGITIEQAAMGIRRVVDENMASAARVHILEKGYDPRRFSMIAFGGAGPVHAFSVARLLGSPQMIIPVGAGVTSALGFLVSPVASEAIRSFVCPLDEIDWQKLNTMLRAMEEEGFEFLRHAKADVSKARITCIADMRYVGQGHEIAVPMPLGELSADSVAEIEATFLKEYQLRYNRTVPAMRLETVTWRVAVSAAAPEITPNQPGAEFANENALKAHRSVWFVGDSTPTETPVFSRYALSSGAVFEGPAIIEEKESTTVIGKNSTVRIDEFKNIVIDLHHAK